MRFHKTIICIFSSSMLFLSIGQKIVKKDTSKPLVVTASFLDTFSKPQPIPTEVKDVAKELQRAQQAINGVYRNMKQEDQEAEKQELALRSLAQTVKSLTHDNTGKSELIRKKNATIESLREENENLLSIIAYLKANPDTVYKIDSFIPIINKKHQITGWERYRKQ